MRLNIRLAKQGPDEQLTAEIALTHKELAEARSRTPLKDLPLYRQLRQLSSGVNKRFRPETRL